MEVRLCGYSFSEKGVGHLEIRVRNPIYLADVSFIVRRGI